MKATYTYGICAMIAAGALLTASACSDNLNADLEPVKTTRVLDVTVDGAKVNSLDLNAAPSETPVQVSSNTRWTVEVTNCEGGWCSVNTINGTGEGAFTIMTLDNMREERDCDVTVYMTDAQGQKDIDGSWTIKVRQEASNVHLTPSSLEPFPAQNPKDQEFTIVSNVHWDLYVTYEEENPIEFVSITPLTGMSSMGGGRYSGDAGATFRMSLQSNRTAADRKAYINLKSDVSLYTVEITQAKSEYTFDVTPIENQVMPAEGGTLSFDILSLSGWDIRTSASWISFSPSSAAEGSEDPKFTIATFQPNPEGQPRTAQIHFVPRNENYQELSVTVTQLSFPMTFSAARIDSQGVLTDKVGEVAVEVVSTFPWQVESPSWISLSTNGGTGSDVFGAGVYSNYSGENRTGFIVITPQPAEVNGVTLHPGAFGFSSVYIGVTQFGGREAAISVPWLRDGYTQTTATVEFNYYSPFYDVVELGLEYTSELTGNTRTMTVTPKDGKEGTATFELTGLDPATKYTARGYVKDEQGNVKQGEWSYPFTTAGQYPDSSDNPTP